jgi:hypothetical protein
VETLVRALATIDAIEADMRWLHGHNKFVLSQAEWDAHVAPWVEPSP